MTALSRLPDDAWADEQVQSRLYEIERVLKFDPRHPDKKQLVREYLDLTDGEQHVADRA